VPPDHAVNVVDATFLIVLSAARMSSYRQNLGLVNLAGEIDIQPPFERTIILQLVFHMGVDVVSHQKIIGREVQHIVSNRLYSQ